MVTDFEPICLTHQHRYQKLFQQCPQIASDYSFTNLWGWKDAYGLVISWSDEFALIKQTRPKPVYWAPVGAWNNINWENTLSKYLKNTCSFSRVPEKLVEIWKSGSDLVPTIRESRGHWDYLYFAEELITLSGNKYHKKKNLLNQFKKKYSYSFVPFDLSCITQAISLQENWCTWRDCESSDTLADENHAIDRVLSNWEQLDSLVGGAIIVDNEMVAYTLGEFLPDNSLIIHFEKGSPEYKGVYQAINQMFLLHLTKSDLYETFKFVNREQDLNDDGLRKAKLSYNPADFVKKYTVDFN